MGSAAAVYVIYQTPRSTRVFVEFSDIGCPIPTRRGSLYVLPLGER